MEGEIYLIGGGEIATGETKVIDDQLIAFSPKGSKFAFFPTAAGDSERYISAVESIFGNHFEVLAPTQDKGKEFARQAIKSATVVYLGGGKTDLLIELFNRWELVPILYDALQGGAIIAGMSAGAQALSAFYVNYDNDPATIEKGWGLANVYCLVHANATSARLAFSVYKSSNSNNKAKQYPFIAIGEKSAWRVRSEKMSKIGDSFVWFAESDSIDISRV